MYVRTNKQFFTCNYVITQLDAHFTFTTLNYLQCLHMFRALLVHPQESLHADW
jgi:hypothetical protein